MTVIKKNYSVEFSTFEKFLIGFAIIFGIVGLLIFISGLFLFNHGESYSNTLKINSSKFGDFGSFVSGAVGSLWAFVGVVLFYITLRMQRKELAMQREELEATRSELEAQKNQMILQNATLTQQRFEDTFFQLLRTQNEIVNSIDIRSLTTQEVISSGRDCFYRFYSRLKTNIANPEKHVEHDPKTADLEVTLRAYSKFFDKHQSDLGHYFRNLYHIIKFVDESEISNKKRYTNFVRAQLSSYELVLLFYNCLSNFGIEKFNPLLIRYSLLKNMGQELIFNQKHLEAYPKKAYSQQ